MRPLRPQGEGRGVPRVGRYQGWAMNPRMASGLPKGIADFRPHHSTVRRVSSAVARTKVESRAKWAGASAGGRGGRASRSLWPHSVQNSPPGSGALGSGMGMGLGRGKRWREGDGSSSYQISTMGGKKVCHASLVKCYDWTNGGIGVHHYLLPNRILV